MNKVFIYAILVILAIFLFLPILLTILYSFFSPEEIRYLLSLRSSKSWMPIILNPSIASLGQYYQVFLGNHGILERIVYSLLYSFAVLLGQVWIVPSLSYALSAYRFRGKNIIFISIILFMLLPFQVTMIPNMLVLRQMRLINTVWAIIIPFIFSPFYIFLLRQYMVGIPKALYEAAQLDGAGDVYCFFHIALPISKPMIGTVLTLSFAEVWNIVEQPLAFLMHREDLYPLSTVFNQLIASPTGYEFAGAALYILPPLLIYFFFMEDIVSSIHVIDIKQEEASL